jgi:non-ribosomal peptide synthetase component F
MISRGRPEVEHVVGLFINMIALRLDVLSNLSISEYFTRVNEELIQAQMIQEMPFEELAKRLKVDNDAGRHPVFQHVFSTDIVKFKQAELGQENRPTLNLPVYRPKTLKLFIFKV